MSKTFRRAAMSTICMLIVAVMSLTGATYAWFTSGDKATVTGMQMDVMAAAGGIEVATTNTSTTQWQTALKLTFDRNNVAPVSTVNGTNFFTAEFNPENTAQIKTAVAENATTTNVISQDLYLRNTGVSDVEINLTGSYVKDIANETLGSAATNIAKAAKMAILYTDSEGNDKAYYLDPYGYETTVEGVTTATVPEAKTEYLGIKAASEGTYFAFAEENTNYSAKVQLTKLAEAKLTLPGIAGAEGEAKVPQPIKITVVLWLEGQDADCVNENAGGAFDVILNFAKVATTPAQGG